jgi:hypothetical protein
MLGLAFRHRAAAEAVKLNCCSGPLSGMLRCRMRPAERSSANTSKRRMPTRQRPERPIYFSHSKPGSDEQTRSKMERH